MISNPTWLVFNFSDLLLLDQAEQVPLSSLLMWLGIIRNLQENTFTGSFLNGFSLHALSWTHRIPTYYV